MADNQDMSDQVDGAADQTTGLLAPSQFDVEVKLIDPNSPLYAAESFEQLGLYVCHTGSKSYADSADLQRFSRASTSSISVRHQRFKQELYLYCWATLL